MSIIERALGRLRPQGEERRPGQPPAVRLRERPAPLALPAREPRTLPSETIRADLEALRRAGVLPRADFTERITEQFRRVKWPLLETALGRGTTGAPSGNTVMIVSSVASEGKTFVCFNLALSIARERDLEVLVVDADVAKRDLTRLLGAEARLGLVDIAADASLEPERLVLGTDIPGLTFLPAGRPTSIASELFSSRRMADAVAALRAACAQRIVLFDCSPLLATTETRVLATLMDQIVMVVCAESTPQPAVLEALSLLDRSRPVHCLLNQTRLSHLNEYYYYGYGYPANERPRLP